MKMRWKAKPLICFWLSQVVFLSSAWKNLERKLPWNICWSCLVLINSVLLNLLCVWIWFNPSVPDPLHVAYRAVRGVEDAKLFLLDKLNKHLELPQTHARILFPDLSFVLNTTQHHILAQRLIKIIESWEAWAGINNPQNQVVLQTKRQGFTFSPSGNTRWSRWGPRWLYTMAWRVVPWPECEQN